MDSSSDKAQANEAGNSGASKVEAVARTQLSGAEAVALAILDAGCTFLSAGPTEIPRRLWEQLRGTMTHEGNTCVATKETRSALSLATGAAMSGQQSATLMSSTGLRLCAEDLDLALRREVALVVVNAQERVQGDVQFVRWASIGGYPVVALVPDTVQACYNLTLHAFRLATHFCMPVFVLADQLLLVQEGTLRVRPPQPLLFAVPAYARDRSRAPYSRQVANKLEPYRDALEQVEIDADMQPSADTLIVAYGATAATAQAGMEQARVAGKAVTLLIIRSLWPVPKGAIRSAVRDAQRVLVVELNFGQYRREIERMLGPHGPEVIGIHRMDGEMVEPSEIAEKCL